MKNPLVIGYKGEIGSYILQGLLRFMPKADTIWCFDINASDDEIRSRLIVSDVVFLCIPMDMTLAFINKYKYHFRNKIIIEQTSLKLWIPKMKSHLKDEFDCELISMHILFRPSVTPDTKDHYVAVVGKKQTTGTTMAKNFVDLVLKAKLVYIETIEQHETIMACQQALVHRVLLVLDNCLRSEFPGTYVSRKVRDLAKRITSGDPKMYEIIQNNPKLKLQLSNFNRQMKTFRITKFMKVKNG